MTCHDPSPRLLLPDFLFNHLRGVRAVIGGCDRDLCLESHGARKEELNRFLQDAILLLSQLTDFNLPFLSSSGP